MSCSDFYFHSFDVVYDVEQNEVMNSFPLIFPDDVTIPANSVVNVDMKIRVNLFCLGQMRFVPAIIVVPNIGVASTPLMNMLCGAPINDGEYAVDLHLYIRNLSDVDVDITAGDSLFSIIHGAHQQMKVKSVAEDDMTMELRPVE